MQDPIGPGTEAWAASEEAIYQGLYGSASAKEAAIDKMTRELLANGASNSTIREWETFIEQSIVDKVMNEDREWVA